MAPVHSSSERAPQDLDARARRLEALETRDLAARCLAGIGQLAEVILGPRARHEELLLEALLARVHPEVLERAQLESAGRELALRGELERSRAALADLSERARQAPEEREAVERAFEEIERELAALRHERDWRSAQMQAVAAELEGLRFGLLAPALQARARAWKAGAP